jgi:hypothetical protein
MRFMIVEPALEGYRGDAYVSLGYWPLSFEELPEETRPWAASAVPGDFLFVEPKSMYGSGCIVFCVNPSKESVSE